MNRRKAVVLGVLTAWPFFYMILFMCMVLGMMMSGLSGERTSSEPPIILLIIVPLHLLTMLEMFALLVIYIVHVFKTDRISQEQKALWAVVLFLGSMIAMPVYWYLYIWKKPKTSLPEPPHAGDAARPPA